MVTAQQEQGLIEDGWLTPEQADMALQALRDARQGLVVSSRTWARVDDVIKALTS